MQQLGRGLRLCAGKDRVIILNFIGNYKRANQIRKYLAKSLSKKGRGRNSKLEYTYATKCQVVFDQSVEDILDRQDAQELGITKEDLIEEYSRLAESLQRKPSRTDLDQKGHYKSAQYVQVFRTWVAFLREIGEYTEASYHYPQGTHIGHILSILKIFGGGTREGSHFDDEYIRLRGKLGDGRISTYRRQVKYKLQAAMELGILPDDRHYSKDETYTLELTLFGKKLYSTLSPTLKKLDLDFPRGDNGIPQSRMSEDELTYNAATRKFIAKKRAVRDTVFKVFLRMHAVQQMLAYLYHVCREPEISRNQIYSDFFKTPFVKQFCDQEGIEIASQEASKRRCPFLLNILDACDVIEAQQKSITVKKLV